MDCGDAPVVPRAGRGDGDVRHCTVKKMAGSASSIASWNGDAARMEWCGAGSGGGCRRCSRGALGSRRSRRREEWHGEDDGDDGDG